MRTLCKIPHMRAFVVIAMLVMMAMPVGISLVDAASAQALSTSNITITVTPGAVGGSCNASTLAAGVVAVGATSNTSIAYFGITNTSTVTNNWTAKATNATWTGGATAWTHSDTATAGVDTAGVKIDRTDSWGGDDLAVPNATSVVFYGSCAATTDFDFGLSVVMPTSSTVNDEKTQVIEISVVTP